MAQVIDKGRIVAAVDKFPAKENGQPLFNNDGTPKLKNKWMAIGEATRWRNDDGSEHVTEKVYLTPIGVQSTYFEQKTFWDSQSQQNGQSQGQQSSGFQQQGQQSGGYQSR